jgi:multiple sugar transport system substrate-binding protein
MPFGKSAPVVLEELNSNELTKLRILGTSFRWPGIDTYYFSQDYQEPFKVQYPSIDLELVDTSMYYPGNPEAGMSLEEIIEKEKPDVFLLNMDQYRKFAEAGRLYPLEGVIAQDRYDTKPFHPMVMRLLAEEGGGQLYGISSFFTSKAILYNKRLFEKYGVELPKDHATWPELMRLAAQFPRESSEGDRIYGLNSRSIREFVLEDLGGTEGLSYYDPGTDAVTLDTPEWNQVFTEAVEYYRSGVTNYGLKPGKDLFITGEAAMTLASPYYTQVLPSHIGAAAVPVSQEGRSIPNWYAIPQSPKFLDSIWAVNANSPNQRAAWEFVKWINSEERAEPYRIQDSGKISGSGLLLSRTMLIQDDDQHGIEAFYRDEPEGPFVEYEHSRVPSLGVVDDLFVQAISAMIEGQITVAEGLKQLQQKVEKELEAYRARMEAAEQKEEALMDAEEQEQLYDMRKLLATLS